ncbi:MAG: MBL fold metallo-hydrolase [Bacteroidota bacterium]
MSSSVSRRDALRGLGLLGLGTAAAPAVFASTPWPVASRPDDHGATPTPYYRAEIGDITAHVFLDTVFNIPPAAFATNAEEGAIQDLLAAHNLPTDNAATAVNVLLLETGGERVLIDTGVGGENGQLLNGLAGAGLSPGDIHKVVISHFHGDHVGGMVRDGAPTFPNASYHFPAPEKAFLDGYEPGDNAQANQGVAMALGVLQPLMDAGVLSLYDDGAALAEGITAKAAPGHTPGHMAFQIASGNASLLVTADAANHYVATFARPEWIFAYDTVPEQTVATRRILYGMASDDGVRVWGTHMPFPGFGMAIRDGEGFRFITAP